MGNYEKRNQNKYINFDESYICSINIIGFNNWKNIGNFSWNYMCN